MPAAGQDRQRSIQSARRMIQRRPDGEILSPVRAPLTVPSSYRGPPERRWWHVEHGDEEAKWVMSIRIDEIAAVQFVREPNPFPHFPGEESLIVRFIGPPDGSALSCYAADLYDGRALRGEKGRAWEALRMRYGNRDESRVQHGSLRPRAAAA